MLVSRLPFSLLGLLILFCSTVACQQGNSSVASDENETIFADLSPAAFAEKMASAPDVVILDVRTPGETAKGIIEGAVELDYRSADFAQQLSALDKDKTYLVYCASGGRSGKTCKLMQDQGFRECYNLLGGYSGWPNK